MERKLDQIDRQIDRYKKKQANGQKERQIRQIDRSIYGWDGWMNRIDRSMKGDKLFENVNSHRKIIITYRSRLVNERNIYWL